MVSVTHEEILKFPADIIVKAIGKSDAEFEKTFLEIIKKHFPNIKENSITQRHSESQNYLALSVMVHAESRKQLDALYQALTDAPEILIAL